MEYIKLKDLVQHRDLQVREALDEDRIKFLATVFEGWDPLIAYKVDGKLYLADGYHRYAAARYAGLQEIPVEIREGPFRDALECALTVNAGSRIKPLTLRERTHGCCLMLEIWTERSDRWIAEDMGVNHETVRGLRETMEATGEIRQLDRLLGKDGKWRPRKIRKPVEPKGELPASIPQGVMRDHPALALMLQGKPIHGTLRTVRVQDIKVCWDYFPRKKLDNDMLRVLRMVKPEAIPPVLVNQDLVLIDGYTRMTLHQMTKRKEVEVEVVECPEDSILLLAAYLNAGPDRGQGPHGQPLGIRNLKRLVISLARGGMPPEKITAELDLRKGDVNRWVFKDSRARMQRATSLPKSKEAQLAEIQRADM